MTVARPERSVPGVRVWAIPNFFADRRNIARLAKFTSRPPTRAMISNAFTVYASTTGTVATSQAIAFEYQTYGGQEYIQFFVVGSATGGCAGSPLAGAATTRPIIPYTGNVSTPVPAAAKCHERCGHRAPAAPEYSRVSKMDQRTVQLQDVGYRVTDKAD